MEVVFILLSVEGGDLLKLYIISCLSTTVGYCLDRLFLKHIPKNFLPNYGKAENTSKVPSTFSAISISTNNTTAGLKYVETDIYYIS